MLKSLLFTSMGIACSFIVQAQEPAAEETVVDSTAPAKPTNSLTLGVSYANNASYYGQKAEEKTPYIAAVAAYRLKSGFYLTGSAFRLLNDSAKIASASSLGAGFAFDIGKKIKADLSYSHTFYPALSPFLQAANNNMASATLSYQYFLKTSIGADYAFGLQQDIFGTFSTSKDILLATLAKGKAGISIEPSIEIVAGTQRFYTTYVQEKRERDSLLGLSLPPIFGGGGSTTTTTTTEETTSFDLLSYNFRLPVSYYRSKYLLELAYQLSLLSNKAQTNPGKINSFVNISFYYQF